MLRSKQGFAVLLGSALIFGLMATGRVWPAPAAGLKFSAAPTVLLIRDGATIKRAVDVTVDNPGPETTVALSVFASGKPVAVDSALASVRLMTGTNAFEVLIPEVAGPTSVRLVLVPARSARAIGRSAPASSPAVEMTLSPARRWTVDLFHHSHTDIGYTELQSRVIQNHLEYLDSVIDYCHQTDAYPDDAKFRWNIEVSWALENYRAMRPEAKFRELVDLIRAGRVELSGIQVNGSDLFAHEEIIRAVENPCALGRRYGFPVRAAMNDDVTGFDWALPQIFRQNGVRYFSTGINETRSRAPLRRPCPFWWESPDGSRVLQWNGEHYLFANYELLVHEPLARSAPKVGEYLAKLEARGDYPYDIVAFNVSGWVTDNCPPGRGLSDRVKEWNEKFVSPHLRLATLHEFFEKLERDFGPKIPVYRLGWPDYWTDGAASTAFETGLNRVAHNELITAEKVSALAARLELDKGKALRFPAEALREAWDQSMLYDEHTWGAWNSIGDPGSELARGQWAVKSAYAYKAREASRTLLRRGLEALARTIGAEGDNEFAVFNPLSWPRTDVVRVTLPAGPLREAKGRLRVIDRRLGSEAKFQMIGDEAILVLAKDIPSMGYALFSVRPGENEVPKAIAETSGVSAAGNTVVENRFYRLTVDAKTGGISSLVDKETGRDLVDQSSPWKLNTYIYEQPQGGRKAVDDMTKRTTFERSSPEATTGLQVEWAGPVAKSLIIRSAPKMCAALEQRVILYDDLKRIDLVNVLDKKETFDPEAVYFAFPFKVGQGQPAAPAKVKGGQPPSKTMPQGSVTVPPGVRFEISDADMAPGKEQLPGTTLDWHTVQNWVEFSGQDARVVWSPVEAPLVEFGDINTGKWLTKLDLANAWVFSYAMNNYWMTNFKASQEGRVEFRYSLTSLPPGPAAADGVEPERVAPSRFGWEVHTPFAAVWLPAKNKGRFTRAAESFVSVDQPGVIIQALWLDPDGTPVARLREIAGKPADARIASAPFLGFSTEWHRGGPETVETDSISVHLKPFEIVTVKLAPGE
jgi:alpha-mannosidase